MQKPIKPKVTWSYSSLSLFRTCPYKYYRLRVVKDVKDEQGEAAIYGQDMHKAAEEFIRDGTPIPGKFQFMRPALQSIAAWPGKKLCEYRMGLREDLTPCDFFARDVWWRGVADLIVISDDGKSARVLDYKSSKSSKYADMEQLDLLAAAVFIHFPEVVTIRAALLFLVCNEMVPEKPKKYEFMFSRSSFANAKFDVKRIETAMDSGVWNPSRNFTCRGWCPVKDCVHWEERRK